MSRNLLCLLAAVFVAASPVRANDAISGKASVIDGDTIEIHGTRIRLFGIDAPESDQPCTINGRNGRCGQLSVMALTIRTEHQTVSCEPKDHDRYGRLVAICRAGDADLSALMVKDGWALAYRQYSTDYVLQEGEARAAKRGIWQTEFVPPWEWRYQQRTAANDKPREAKPADSSGACVIKGNISIKTGERIYHVPGGQYYGRTVIDPSKGERWFCSEAEAQAAGWRRSMR